MISSVLVDCRVGLWMKLLLSAQHPQQGSFVLVCFFLIFLVAECPEAKRVNKMGKDVLEKFS